VTQINVVGLSWSAYYKVTTTEKAKLFVPCTAFHTFKPDCFSDEDFAVSELLQRPPPPKKKLKIRQCSYRSLAPFPFKHIGQPQRQNQMVSCCLFEQEKAQDSKCTESHALSRVHPAVKLRNTAKSSDILTGFLYKNILQGEEDKKTTGERRTEEE
jgi:hypothetical protein